MTTEELRELAARVRQDIIWLPELDRCREAQDALRLAEAVLAAGPADDAEPVTALWLESVGFGRRKAPSGVQYHEIRIDMRPDDGEPDGGLALRVHGASDGWCPMDLWDSAGRGVAIRLWDELTTRGTVRRLCAAMGLVLTEPK